MVLLLKEELSYCINENDSLKHRYMIQRIYSVLDQDGLAAILSGRLVTFSRQDRFLTIRRNSASRMLSNFFISATSRVLMFCLATAFLAFAVCLFFVDPLAEASLTLFMVLLESFFFKLGLSLDACANILAFMLGCFGEAADVGLASCDGRLDDAWVGVGFEFT